jgi:hypothetical protein
VGHLDVKLSVAIVVVVVDDDDDSSVKTCRGKSRPIPQKL